MYIVLQSLPTLNEGAWAALGGNSRATIKIYSPKNTMRWYYSFITSPGEDGTELLNLAVQIGVSLYTGGLSNTLLHLPLSS